MAVITYRDAGVDVAAGDALVEAIKPLAAATRRAGVLGGLGGFGGLFALREAGAFCDPVLVSGTDGVGTKLKIAFQMGVHDTVGIDLVAMCVNDVLTSGAEPLFFLDYFATGELDLAVAREVIAGIAEGCRQAGCALLGGETAEMPDMYAPGEYDLAGFAVGVVERDLILDGVARAQVGDAIVGVPSSGIHSNGLSLVRKVLPWQSDEALARELLTPTRIYTAEVRALLGAADVRALCHITGGGIDGNLPRGFGPGLCARLTPWPLPPIFERIASAGVAVDELRRTFNVGVGLCAIVPADQAELAIAAVEGAFVLGELKKRREGGPGVEWT